MATVRKTPAGKKAAGKMAEPLDRAQSANARPLAIPGWWAALTLEAAIVALLIALLCVTAARGEEPVRPYGNDYARAYRDSRLTGKPLLVMVSAEWCQPCRELMVSLGMEFPKRGCFVRLNWDRDQPAIRDIVSSERFTLPSLWIWERDSKGEWRRQSFHGASAIREWIRPFRRPPSLPRTKEERANGSGD